MQPPHPLFIPECYADTALMLTLLRENADNEKELAKYVNHQHGIGNVGSLMDAEYDPRRRVVGLVDLDKKFHEQPYLAQFELRAGSLERKAGPHAVLQHPTRPTQYLLALNPAFETWLADRAAELGTTLVACGLPAETKAFKTTAGCRVLSGAANCGSYSAPLPPPGTRPTPSRPGLSRPLCTWPGRCLSQLTRRSRMWAGAGPLPASAS